MPIRWHLKALLAERGMTAYELAKATGLTVSATYKLVRHEGVPRLEVDTLDALCRVLECQPGDLLEYGKR